MTDNSLDFTGKVALVTGAGSPGGIGFAIARRLLSADAALAITATTARIEERAEELNGLGHGKVMARVADLTDPQGTYGVSVLNDSKYGSGVPSQLQDHWLDGEGRQLQCGHRIPPNVSASSGRGRSTTVRSVERSSLKASILEFPGYRRDDSGRSLLSLLHCRDEILGT